ncbi:MAG: hypothetical protein NC192_02680 [Muribaculaceae bacterium]|nr:hypothetical protein [Muribaculaceae bacterium]
MVKYFLLTIAVCTDSFAVSAGVGGAGIKVPFRSAVTISFTGAFFLTLSAALSEVLKRCIDSRVFGVLSFGLLLGLGIINLFQNFFKEIILKSPRLNGDKKLPAKLTKLFFDGTAADADNSKSISVKEALVLSAALSADSVVTGISSGSLVLNLPLLSARCFLTGIPAVLLGTLLGKKLHSALKTDLGWLSGAVLIVLAFLSKLHR